MREYEEEYEDEGGQSIEDCTHALIGLVLSNPASIKNVVKPMLPIVGDKRALAILEVADKLDEGGYVVDLNTICAELTRQGKLKDLGGPKKAKEYIFACRAKALRDLTAVDSYVKIIESAHRLKNLLSLCGTVQAAATEPGADPDQIAAMLDDGLKKHREARSTGDNLLTLRDLMKQFVPELIAVHEEGLTKSITTTFPKLDKYMGGGMYKGETTLLKGPSNGGKTTLALLILFHHALVEDRHVLLVSPEMTKDQLFYKFLALIFGVHIERLRTGNTPKDEHGYTTKELQRSPATWAEIKDTLLNDKAVRNYDKIDNIHIFSQSPVDTVQVCNAFYKTKAEVEAMGATLDLVVVDYLQLVESAGKKYDNRQVEVDATARKLRGVMKDSGVPQIMLCQINDDGKERESRALYMHSDTVLLMEPDKAKKRTKVKIQKGRMHDNKGSVTLGFNGALGIYEELDIADDDEELSQEEYDTAQVESLTNVLGTKALAYTD